MRAIKVVLHRDGTLFALVTAKRKPGVVYGPFLKEGVGLYRSRDGGDTWEPFTDFPFANTQRVQFDPADPDVIYVTTFGASVWKGPARPQ